MGELVAADDLLRLDQIAGDFLGAHQKLPPIGERRLLARLRRQRLELLDRGAQEIRLARRGLERRR